MKHICLKLAGLAGMVAAVANGQVKLNENFSVSGYTAGSYRILDPEPGASSDRFDLDAAKVLFSADFKPVTGVTSFFYQPNAPEDVTILDAYVTYATSSGTTITGGKFLSWLGYEAFDIPNMAQITYANGDFLGPIPGYHSGVKVEFGDNQVAGGLAVVDSVYSGTYYLRGDGELKKNAGFEGYVVYKAIPDLTLWAGFAYDTKGNQRAHEILTLDVWAQYQLTKELAIAGEIVHKDGGTGDEGYNWLAYANYTFTDTVSSTFRVSGEDIKSGPSFLRATVAPAVKLTDHLLVRAEVSYTDYKDFSAADNALFFGVQGVFKF